MPAFRYSTYSFFLPSTPSGAGRVQLGNTRIILNDRKDKKIIGDVNEMKFNESIVSYKKWSGQRHLLTANWWAAGYTPEYKVEAYGDGLSSHSLSAEQNPVNPKSLPAPVARRLDSQLPPVYKYRSKAGDHYRDANAVQDPLAGGPPSRQSSRAVSDHNRVAAIRRHSVHNASQERLAMGSPVNQFSTFPDLRMSRSMSPALKAVRPMSTFSMVTTVCGAEQQPEPHRRGVVQSSEDLFEHARFDDRDKQVRIFFRNTWSIADDTRRTAREAIAAQYPPSRLDASQGLFEPIH